MEDSRNLLDPNRSSDPLNREMFGDLSVESVNPERPPHDEPTQTDERLENGAPVIRASTKNRHVAEPLSSSEKFGHAYHRLLLMSDLIALLISSVITFVLVIAIGRVVDAADWAFAIVALAPVWALIAYQLGLYGQVERQLDFDYVAELMPIIFASTVWCWFLVLVRSFIVVGYAELITPAVMWVIMVPTLLFCRSAARALARSRPWHRRPIALIGDAATVAFLDERMKRHPEWGLSPDLEVVRFDGQQGWQVRRHSREDGPSMVSEIHQVEGNDLMAIALTSLVSDAGIDRVMVAGGIDRLSARTELVHSLTNRGIAVDYVSGGPETLYANAMPQHLEGMSLLSSRPSYPRPMGAFLKRSIDVALSAGFLLVTFPFLVLSAIAVKLDSKGPVVFRQPRTGLKGEMFQICKLRTMCDGADDMRESLWSDGIHGRDGGMLKLQNDPRVTRVGAFLRKWSLDEIPQFWNVLVGDMSLVGPRPLPLDESSEIEAKYKARQRVRPGITGPWQVMGRSDIPMEDMLKLDCTYVTGWSLSEDLRILLRTLSAVSGKSGVY